MQNLDQVQGNEKIDLLIDLGEAFKKKDKEKSRDYLYEALTLTRKSKIPAAEPRILKTIGLTFYYDEKYPAALDYYHLSLASCEQMSDSIEMANVLFNIGLIYRDMEQWEKALTSALQVLEMDEKSGNQYGLGYSYNNLGLLYQKMNDLTKAKTYFLKSLNTRQAIKHQEGIGYSCINLGTVAVKQQQYDSAKYYFEKSAQIFLDLDDPYEYGKSIYSLGNVHWYQGHFTEADYYYRKALSIRIKNHASNQDLAESYISLGFLAGKQQQYRQADSLYSVALNYARKANNLRQISDIQHRLYISATKQEHWREAVNYLSKHNQNLGKLYDAEKMKKFKNLESVYELEKSQAALEKVRQEKELVEANNRLTWWINGAVIFLLSIVIVFVVAFLYIKNQNLKLLNVKNQQLQNLNYSLDQFVYIVSHDLKAPISSAKGLLKLIKQEEINETVLKYLNLQDQSLNKLENFIADLLNYSRNSRSEIQSSKISLEELLKDIKDELQFEPEAKGIDFSMSIDQQNEFYSDLLRVRMIFSNLISNAIRYKNKYIGDPKVQVILSVFKDKLDFKIVDNGIGISENDHNKIFSMFFKSGNHPDSSGLGLFIVKEALNNLGGKIDFDSHLNKGTTFYGEIPNLNYPV
ncbi:MAG: tetratricopeptide repeat protein [Candidatus Cyclobacteriaceae bacterium M3_2C_046]